MTTENQAPEGGPTLPHLPMHPEPHMHTWTALEARAIEQYGRDCALAAQPGPVSACPCGDRPAAECDEQWGPKCDMGNNPAHARQAPAEGDEPDRDAAIRMWHRHCDKFGDALGRVPPSPVIDAMLAFARAHVQPKGTLCPCGDRAAEACDEQWGPQCDLGNNPAFVRVAPAAQAPAPGAALPGDMVLVPRELLKDAAESVDDYRAGVEFGSCDRKLLGRLKAASGQPKADQQMTDEACQWVNSFFSAKGFYPSLAQCYLAGKAVAPSPAVDAALALVRQALAGDDEDLANTLGSVWVEQAQQLVASHPPVQSQGGPA